MPPVQIERSAAPLAQIGGRELEVFAGCDYLGLAHAPEVHDALRQGVERYGISAGGSRATTGNTAAHDALEHDLARFLGLEAALLVPDGYMSSHIFAQGIARHRPRVLVDREAHVSTRDALAASGLAASAYTSCDADSAAAERAGLSGRVLVMTDGVYPVLRGIAPLAQLLALVPGDGWLAVDDAHGTGVLGARGRGTHEHLGIVDPRLVVTGTLSKALGCFGGFVAGARAVVDEVAAHSHAFVGSTPIPPALASAASAALEMLERDPSRLTRLRANIAHVRGALRDAGIDAHDLPLPVFAWKTATSEAADRAQGVFARHGLLIPHVRYPDGLGSYFRLAVSAVHGPDSIGRLAAALLEVMEKP